MHAQCALDRYAKLLQEIKLESLKFKMPKQQKELEIFPTPQEVTAKVMFLDLDSDTYKSLAKALSEYTVFYDRLVKKVLI